MFFPRKIMGSSLVEVPILMVLLTGLCLFFANLFLLTTRRFQLEYFCSQMVRGLALSNLKDRSELENELISKLSSKGDFDYDLSVQTLSAKAVSPLRTKKNVEVIHLTLYQTISSRFLLPQMGLKPSSFKIRAHAREMREM